MHFRKYRNAARMNESSTIEASKDKKIEEFDGTVIEKGEEKEDRDNGIELAGSCRRSNIVENNDDDDTETAAQRREQAAGGSWTTRTVGTLFQITASDRQFPSGTWI